MKTISLIVWLVLSSLSLIAQLASPVISSAENDDWMNTLQSSSLVEKKGMIKKRIIQDTAIYYPGLYVPSGILSKEAVHIPQNYVDGLDFGLLNQDSFIINGIKGEGRLLYGFRLKP